MLLLNFAEKESSFIFNAFGERIRLTQSKAIATDIYVLSVKIPNQSYKNRQIGL